MINNLSRFLLAGVFAAAMIPAAHAQDRDRDRDRGRSWEQAREVIARTMEDLRHIDRRDSSSGDDRERYEKAMRSLSDFDRSVSEGHFDKGKLDEAIEQVDRVMHSKMLDPRERDRVTDDLRDLRRLREEWR